MDLISSTLSFSILSFPRESLLLIFPIFPQDTLHLIFKSTTQTSAVQFVEFFLSSTRAERPIDISLGEGDNFGNFACKDIESLHFFNCFIYA